jgi:hypothetical protein
LNYSWKEGFGELAAFDLSMLGLSSPLPLWERVAAMRSIADG